MIHTATITHIISADVRKKFLALQDTQYYEQKSRCFNNRYKSKGIVVVGYYVNRPRFSIFNLSIKINFKKLIDENYDKKELLTSSDLSEIETNFNDLIQKFDIGLPLFETWKVNRIDYCINVKTPYVKEYINILNKSDMPSNLSYSSGDNNNYSKNNDSFYLVRKKNGKKKCKDTIRINFYNKQEQLKNLKRKGKNVSEEQIAAAKDILRLEVQCFKTRTEYLKTKYKMDTKNIIYFLEPTISYNVIYQALSKIARPGEYRRKSKALDSISKSKYSTKVKDKLEQIIDDIAKQHSAVYKVREKYLKEGMKKATFNNYLKYFDKLNINPVTISDKQPLKDKRYDEGLSDLFTLFEQAFYEAYYEKKIEVDIE